MTKKEAADFLGVSTRTLERNTEKNLIAGRYEKGKTSDVLVYDRAELERFKAERESPTHLPTVEPSNRMETPSATNSANPDKSLARFGEGRAMGGDANEFAFALMQALAQLQPQLQPASVSGDVAASSEHSGPAATPPAQKLLLSLAEAQSYSGLSRANLMEAIHAQTLAAQKIGRGWKIKRRDLESYIEGL